MPRPCRRGPPAQPMAPALPFVPFLLNLVPLVRPTQQARGRVRRNQLASDVPILAGCSARPSLPCLRVVIALKIPGWSTGVRTARLSGSTTCARERPGGLNGERQQRSSAAAYTRPAFPGFEPARASVNPRSHEAPSMRKPLYCRRSAGNSFSGVSGRARRKEGCAGWRRGSEEAGKHGRRKQREKRGLPEGEDGVDDREAQQAGVPK